MVKKVGEKRQSPFPFLDVPHPIAVVRPFAIVWRGLIADRSKFGVLSVDRSPITDYSQ